MCFSQTTAFKIRYKKKVNMFDFDKQINRRNTNSLKWDVNPDELPLWVADMDFSTAPAVVKAVTERAASGVYGYNIVPEQWNEAICNWWQQRHNHTISPDSLIFATGVVPIISSVVRKLTTPAEKVLVLSPVYNIFFNSIENNGRIPLECKLVFDGTKYDIDFADLSSKLADKQTSLMLLCNPHNPGGIVWTKEQLAEIGRLAYENGVVVLSDEIHCDLTDPDVEYTPFASVNDTCKYNSVTCISATKAFNIAGLQCAACYADNPVIRHKVWRALNTDEVAEPNCFAIQATIAAFTQGAPWLDELRQYVYKNKQYVSTFLQQNIPQIKVVDGSATYLMWLYVGKITDNSAELCKQIRDKTGLYLSDGAQFRGDGNLFVRINVACPRATLAEAMRRLQKALS